MKYISQNINKAIEDLKIKYHQMQLEKARSEAKLSSIVTILKASWSGEKQISAEQLELQRKYILKWIKADLDKLYKDHELGKALIKCQSLGCGSCSIDHCLMANELINCLCPQCPFRSD